MYMEYSYRSYGWAIKQVSINFKGTEITPNMLSDQDSIKSEINHNKISQKSLNFGIPEAIHFKITQGSKDKPQKNFKNISN